MKFAIVMGSDSDYPVVEKALKIFKHFGVEYEVRVLSAHRTPHETTEFATKAAENGFEVIIAAAGKAAALPGVIASCTLVPVIGLPIKGSALAGMDGLYSIVQMPSGIPVATVALDGAENAALLAIQILSIKYRELYTKLQNHREEMRKTVLGKDEHIRKISQE